MRRQTDQQEIEDMRPVAWKADGTPVRFEVVQRDQAQHPRPIGHDDAPIVSPLPEARVVKAQSVVEGSWSDRARAFNISTLNLSIVTGILATIAALVFGASVSFFALALYFFGGFTLAWLVAYLLHTFVSAEGAQMADTLLLWHFLFTEQRYRHQRYSESERLTLLRTIVGALAVGVTALFVALIIIGVALEWMPR